MSATAVPADRPARALLAAVIHRQPALTWFGIALLVLALPTALAALLDPRLYGAVSVWTKPLKFQLSVGLFALTAAWAIGCLPAARRRAWPVRLVVWTILATGAFEIAYITLQGGLGEASHFNVSTPLHGALFQLMGLAALLLTATSGLLGWELARHGDRRLAPGLRLALVLGLVLTALLGIASGFAIGANGGPRVGGLAGDAGLPLLGWSTTGGDLRPAHFLGVHAQQILPLAWLLLQARWPRRARLGVVLVALLHGAATVALFLQATAGRPLLAA